MRVPVAHIDHTVYYYRSHPGSTTLGGNIDSLLTTLDEKLAIGKELIEKGGLDPSELRHLHKALALQVNPTLIKTFRSAEWRKTAEILSKVLLSGSPSLGAILTEAYQIGRRHLVKRRKAVTTQMV